MPHSVATFPDRLRFGNGLEERVADGLRAEGWAVYKTYETGGAELLSDDRVICLPDILAFKDGRRIWVEVKNKTVTSWRGVTGKWQTAIDVKYWLDYLETERVTGIPVWLYFFHNNPQARPADISVHGAPARCPTGLWRARISRLVGCISHEWTVDGVPMIYWDLDRLVRMPDEE